MKGKVTEAERERAVCSAAKAMGMSVHKWKGANEKGLPDRIFIIPGALAHWFLIEFKTPEGVLSPSQKRKISHFQSIGVHVYVCDSTSKGLNILELQKTAHEKRLKILLNGCKTLEGIQWPG